LIAGGQNNQGISVWRLDRRSFGHIWQARNFLIFTSQLRYSISLVDFPAVDIRSAGTSVAILKTGFGGIHGRVASNQLALTKNS